jgi:hypothetical protein
LLFLAASCLLALLALEFSIRQFLPSYDPRNQVMCRRNDEGLMLGIPLANIRQGVPKGDFFISISFNRYGFYDPKDLAQSSTNDIFVVGDSQTFGWGVEESNRFSTLLETSLGVPIYNIAMVNNDFRGYGQLVAFAQRHGAQIRNLIIGVCMENDLQDYAKAEDALLARPPACRSLKRRLAEWGSRHSALWGCSSFTLQKIGVFRQLFEWVGVARSVEQLTRRNQDNSRILEVSRDELLKLAAPFNTVILVIPSRALWYGKNRAVEEKVHTGFTQLIRSAGLKVVDMKPVFEASGDPLHCYHAHDPHWTAKAHGLAANALVAALRSNPDWKSLERTKAVAQARQLPVLSSSRAGDRLPAGTRPKDFQHPL